MGDYIFYRAWNGSHYAVFAVPCLYNRKDYSFIDENSVLSDILLIFDMDKLNYTKRQICAKLTKYMER